MSFGLLGFQKSSIALSIKLAQKSYIPGSWGPNALKCKSLRVRVGASIAGSTYTGYKGSRLMQQPYISKMEGKEPRSSGSRCWQPQLRFLFYSIGLGFRVYGLGFRVYGFGLMVLGLGFRVCSWSNS